MKEEDYVRFTLRVKKELYEKIQEYAQIRGISIAAAINIAIFEFIETTK